VKARLFVAIEIPEEVLAAVSDVQETLKQRDTHGWVRWTRPEGIHLTLKFLGDTERRLVPAIEEALTAACSCGGALSLSLGEVSAFPNLTRPRVIMVTVTGPDNGAALRALQERVEKSMVRLGFPREEREFRPHLTLGRTRRGPRQVQQEVSAMLATRPAVPELAFGAREVSLMESTLRSDGAVYECLARVPLRVP